MHYGSPENWFIFIWHHARRDHLAAFRRRGSEPPGAGVTGSKGGMGAGPGVCAVLKTKGITKVFKGERCCFFGHGLGEETRTHGGDAQGRWPGPPPHEDFGHRNKTLPRH